MITAKKKNKKQKIRIFQLQNLTIYQIVCACIYYTCTYVHKYVIPNPQPFILLVIKPVISTL